MGWADTSALAQELAGRLLVRSMDDIVISTVGVHLSNPWASGGEGYVDAVSQAHRGG